MTKLLWIKTIETFLKACAHSVVDLAPIMNYGGNSYFVWNVSTLNVVVRKNLVVMCVTSAHDRRKSVVLNVFKPLLFHNNANFTKYFS